MRILLVTEDPEVIAEVRAELTPLGASLCTCLGPAENRCQLEVRATCTLADHADVVLVDTPPTGIFSRHTDVIQAGSYAEKLARRHPEAWVILCGAPIGLAGPTGDITTVRSRREALNLLVWALGPGPSRVTPPRGRK